MVHSNEDLNQDAEAAHPQALSVGERAVYGLQAESEGASYVDGHQLDEEDPLAGDVDRFVHPDQTRTDEQIEFDRRNAIEPYGHDAAEEYGAEMDEYLGVNDFAEEPEPAEPALTIEPHKGYPDGSQIYVKTAKRTYQENPGNIQKMRDEGMSDAQIAEKLDTDYDETWKRIREDRRKTAAQMEEDDYEGEDPLAGDVDR